MSRTKIKRKQSIDELHARSAVVMEAASKDYFDRRLAEMASELKEGAEHLSTPPPWGIIVAIATKGDPSRDATVRISEAPFGDDGRAEFEASERLLGMMTPTATDFCVMQLARENDLAIRAGGWTVFSATSKIADPQLRSSIIAFHSAKQQETQA